MPAYENTEGPYGGGPANELELELHLQAVTLRDFDFRLAPLYNGFPVEVAPNPIDGLELLAVAKDTGLRVSLRFERGEFVNVATAGLAMLDAGDATEIPEGR